jgi:lon-related putative ATP-dependent protease
VQLEAHPVNQEISPAQMRQTFDPATLDFETTDNLKPLEGIIGQPRAVAALQFGLGIQGAGFNIYAAGTHGTGKMTAVQSFLAEFARVRPTPRDLCYVNNFEDPYLPTALSLPAGRARQLQADMKTLIDHARREIPKAFEGEEYAAKREEIRGRLDKDRESVMSKINARAAQAGFTIQATPSGIALIPIRHGRPLEETEFDALPAPQREEIRREQEALGQELGSAMKQLRGRQREAQQEQDDLDRQVALYVVGGLIEDLREKYQDLAEVVPFLQSAQRDILDNIDAFKGEPTAPSPAREDRDPIPAPRQQELAFRKYQVNVLVDNGKQEGAPVVVELNPSYSNLFGRIEKETRYGAAYTDLTMIKAGSLHRANGGYLVLPAEDLLRNLYSWDALKGALRSGEIQIEELAERLGYVATKSLRPQPIPLNVKVILVGSPLLYEFLRGNDELFPELFKVKAEFDNQMARTDRNLHDFIELTGMLVQKDNLKPLDRGAMAKLLEHASRLAEDQTKLSTRFGALTDVVREAHFWARQEGAETIQAPHIQKAIDAKIYRSSLMQERVQEMMARGSLLIDTTGMRIGQVNGLSVLSLGDYDFGKPSRITASVGPGREGIVDIERQVELGGPLHSKGVLILSGYLRQKYAADQPLTLAAQLGFEQSYSGVEGDSASSAELYALLSALARAPIQQSIAVTGSVNQHGEVQAIGGVNEKIESFFDLCRIKGLTGKQGVIIPQSNVQNLMLREQLVEAVKRGEFHVWGVQTIDEGIEILTGLPAGERHGDGAFEKRSLNALIEERLAEFAGSWGNLIHGVAVDGSSPEVPSPVRIKD